MFRLRRPCRVKVLHHDGGGKVLVTRWPDEGSVCWPPVSEGLLRLTGAEVPVLFAVYDRRALKGHEVWFAGADAGAADCERSTLTIRDGLLLGLFEGLVERSGAQGLLWMISFQSRAASGRHRWTLGSCLTRASAFYHRPCPGRMRRGSRRGSMLRSIWGVWSCACGGWEDGWLAGLIEEEGGENVERSVRGRWYRVAGLRW